MAPTRRSQKRDPPSLSHQEKTPESQNEQFQEEETHLEVFAAEEGEAEDEEPEPEIDQTSKNKKRTRASASKKSPIKSNGSNGYVSKSVRKNLFGRVWTEDDEIVILTGLIDFSAQTGAKPSNSTDMHEFLDFIKKSLHLDCTATQLADKVRGLRKNYHKFVQKGKFPVKPHSKRTFDLSYKIWGTGPAEKIAQNGEIASEPHSEANSDLPRKISGDRAPTNCNFENLRCDMNVGLDGDFVKRGLELIGAEKRAELEAKWKRQHLDELEILAKRAGLMQEQASVILEAYKSSCNQ